MQKVIPLHSEAPGQNMGRSHRFPIGLINKGFYSTATKLFFNVKLQNAIIRKIFFLKIEKNLPYLPYSRYVIMEVSNSFYAVLFPLRQQSLLISLPIETSKEVQWSKGWPVIESSKSPNIFSHLPLVPTVISISVVSVSGGQDNI